MNIFSTLTRTVFHFFRIHEFPALFFLLLIEEAGVPIPVPGDSLVALAGAHPHMTLGYIAAVLATSTAAVFCGSSILYFVVRHGGRPLVDKYGKYVHLHQDRLDRLERWFERRGVLAMILGRLIPGLRMPTTAVAGMANVPYRVFAPSVALAGLIWSAIYFWIGAFLNRHAGVIASFTIGLLDTLTDSALFVIAVVLLLLLVVVWYVVRRRLARKHRASARLDGETRAARASIGEMGGGAMQSGDRSSAALEGHTAHDDAFRMSRREP